MRRVHEAAQLPSRTGGSPLGQTTTTTTTTTVFEEVLVLEPRQQSTAAPPGVASERSAKQQFRERVVGGSGERAAESARLGAGRVAGRGRRRGRWRQWRRRRKKSRGEGEREVRSGRRRERRRRDRSDPTAESSVQQRANESPGVRLRRECGIRLLRETEALQEHSEHVNLPTRDRFVFDDAFGTSPLFVDHENRVPRRETSVGRPPFAVKFDSPSTDLVFCAPPLSFSSSFFSFLFLSSSTNASRAPEFNGQARSNGKGSTYGVSSSLEYDILETRSYFAMRTTMDFTRVF